MGSPENFQMQYDLVSELAAAAHQGPGCTPQHGPLPVGWAAGAVAPPHPPGRTPPPEITELSASVTRTTTRSEHKRRRCGPDLSLEQDGQSRELFREEEAAPGDGGGGGGGGSPGGSRRVVGGGRGPPGGSKRLGGGGRAEGCREEEEEQEAVAPAAAAAASADPVDASSQQEPPAALAFSPEERGALDTCDGFFQNLLGAPEANGVVEQQQQQQRRRRPEEEEEEEEEEAKDAAAGGVGSSESLFRQELSKVMLGGGCSRGGGGSGCGGEAAGDSQGSTDHPQEAPAAPGSAAAGPVGEKVNGGEEEEGEDLFGTPVARTRRRTEGGGGGGGGGGGETSLDAWQFAFGGVPGVFSGLGHAAEAGGEGAALPGGAMMAPQSPSALRMMAASADSDILRDIIQGRGLQRGCGEAVEGQGEQQQAEGVGDEEGTPGEVMSLPSPLPTPPSGSHPSPLPTPPSGSHHDHGGLLGPCSAPGTAVPDDEGFSMGGFSIGIDTLLGVDDASPGMQEGGIVDEGLRELQPPQPHHHHHNQQCGVPAGAPSSCIGAASAQPSRNDRPFGVLFQH